MMKYAVPAAAVFALAVYWAVSSVVHFVAGHLIICCLALFAGVPLLAIVIAALIKGTSRHVVIAWQSRPAAARGQLPSPLNPALYMQPSGVFTAEAQDDSDDDEPAGVLCTLPGCGEQIGDESWTVNEQHEDAPDDEPVERPFCSEAHAGLWIEQVQPAA